jgi:hypothetical protein
MFKLIDIINMLLFVVLPITMLSFVLPPLDYAIMGVWYAWNTKHDLFE